MTQAYQACRVASGASIDYTPSSDIAAGQVVVLNSLVGVAERPIAANQLGALAVVGMFGFVKDSSDITGIGVALYWDADGNPVGGTAGTGALSTTATGSTFAGWSLELVGTTAETVLVLLRSVNDSTAIEVFAHPRANTLVSIGYLAAGSDFGTVDDSNTSVFSVTDGAGNAIVSKTYNTATQPTANALNDLGTVDGTHKVLTAAEIVKLAITNGGTAKTPAGYLVIRTIPTNA